MYTEISRPASHPGRRGGAQTEGLAGDSSLPFARPFAVAKAVVFLGVRGGPTTCVSLDKTYWSFVTRPEACDLVSNHPTAEGRMEAGWSERPTRTARGTIRMIVPRRSRSPRRRGHRALPRVSA